MGMGELGEGWVDSADVRHLEDVIMRAHEVRELQHLVGAHLGPAAPAQRRRRLVQRLRRERGRSESAKRNGSVGEIRGQKCRISFSGSFAENGPPCCCATKSPMACVCWVGHGIGRLDVRGGVLVRRLGWYGEKKTGEDANSLAAWR
jgi:hypothetical protein